MGEKNDDRDRPDGERDLLGEIEKEVARDMRTQIAQRLGRFGPWLAGAVGLACLATVVAAIYALVTGGLGADGALGFVALLAIAGWLFVEALIVLRRARR